MQYVQEMSSDIMLIGGDFTTVQDSDLVSNSFCGLYNKTQRAETSPGGGVNKQTKTLIAP